MNISFKDIDITNAIHTDIIIKLVNRNDFYRKEIILGLKFGVFKHWNYTGMFLMDSVKVVGFILFTPYNLLNKDGCLIQFLLVDKSYQNKKIGTLVVNKFKKDFNLCGVVVKGDEHLFWQKFNFIKVEFNFIKVETREHTGTMTMIYSGDSEFVKSILFINELKKLSEQMDKL
jgi:hypothetical protein